LVQHVGELGLVAGRLVELLGPDQVRMGAPAVKCPDVGPSNQKARLCLHLARQPSLQQILASGDRPREVLRDDQVMELVRRRAVLSGPLGVGEEVADRPARPLGDLPQQPLGGLRLALLDHVDRRTRELRLAEAGLAEVRLMTRADNGSWYYLYTRML